MAPNQEQFPKRNATRYLRFFRHPFILLVLFAVVSISLQQRATMQLSKSPLRRIVARELVVFEQHRNSTHPRLFALHDHLECGHVRAVLTLDLIDLTNPHSENSEIRARRHRCAECAAVASGKKPVALARLELVGVA